MIRCHPGDAESGIEGDQILRVKVSGLTGTAGFLLVLDFTRKDIERRVLASRKERSEDPLRSLVKERGFVNFLTLLL